MALKENPKNFKISIQKIKISLLVEQFGLLTIVLSFKLWDSQISATSVF